MNFFILDFYKILLYAIPRYYIISLGYCNRVLCKTGLFINNISLIVLETGKSKIKVVAG